MIKLDWNEYLEKAVQVNSEGAVLVRNQGGLPLDRNSVTAVRTIKAFEVLFVFILFSLHGCKDTFFFFIRVFFATIFCLMSPFCRKKGSLSEQYEVFFLLFLLVVSNLFRNFATEN